MENITAKSYTLRKENGQWLGQIVLTSGEDFRSFLIGLNVDYFGGKMYQGMAYMIYGKKYELACMRFAKEILPALQKILKEEIESEG